MTPLRHCCTHRIVLPQALDAEEDRLLGLQDQQDRELIEAQERLLVRFLHGDQ